MKSNLKARDLAAVVGCLRDLYAQRDSSALPMRMLELLSVIVPSNLAGFTEVDPVLGQSTGYLYPAGKWDATKLAPRFQEHIHEHPVIQYVQRTRDGQAKAISDFLTPRQFHATGLYREIFRPMGAEDQLSIGMVGSAGTMIGLSFNRARRGFSQRDRDILNLLRPHLIRAYLNCRDLEQLRNGDPNRRGAVIDHLPLGLICVDSNRRIVWSTEPAREMLNHHFADAADSIHGLPDQLRRWLNSIDSGNASDSVALRQTSPRRPGFELRIRFSPLQDSRAILLLQEEPLDASCLSLKSYALTDREEQVFRGILNSETVAKIAVRLHISRRTVQKHLERIFRKLGVNSQSAACLKALRF